jgi:hypothetical protein
VSATEFPEIGFRFRCDSHANINGWQCNGGGFYLNDGKEDCCMDTFSPFTTRFPNSNPYRLMLVRTKAITHTSTGGVDIEEISEWIVVERKRSDEFLGADSDCSMNGQDFLFTVLDRRKKTLVGIIWDGKQFTQNSYSWRVFPCADTD